MTHGLMRAAAGAAIMVALAGGFFIYGTRAAAQGRQGGEPAADAPSRPAPVRDLSGVWFKRTPRGVPSFDGSTWTPGQPPPLSAWGLEQRKANRPNNSGEYLLHETNDPVLTKCYPPGTPRVYFHPYPFEFIQTPRAILQVFEYDHIIRRMWTDGRSLPEDPDLLWMGTSVGRWLDDYTFEVQTVGFNTKTWIDRAGTPHSEQMKVTERFKRVAYDRLEVDFIIEDPKALTKPWVSKGYFVLRNDWDLGEISCSGDYLDYAAVEK